ncbi:hypothetical protein M0811_09636 [Anaeramoeba ignava]|uniref:HTH CENPB-type domain-containing protein n=1 Tax=Anaeramoeba ignava TaxID=1746090 RepID=A0A9Q0LFP8_ANAIG|nr:hypothetical protein M0811_09636 [Anaeramoeba ignava]
MKKTKSLSQLEKAIEHKKKHPDKSIRSVASLFGVAWTTLRDHIKNPQMKIGKGASKKLTEAQEKEFCLLICSLVDRGFIVSGKMLKSLACDFAKEKDITLKASNNWVSQFCKNNNLSSRATELLEKPRANHLTSEIINNWFDLLESIIKINKIPPKRIFNMDECGTRMDVVPKRTYCEKGRKCIEITGNSASFHVSTVGTTNAGGSADAPYLIFKGIRKNHRYIEDAHPGILHDVTSTGYMTLKCFESWMDHFLTWAEQFRDNPNQVMLLLLDGYFSHHGCLPALQKAQNQNVIVLVFPSHTTSQLQPEDVGIFKSFKTYLGNEFENWKIQNPDQKIQKCHFSQLCSHAWVKCMSKDNIKNSFRATGIYPLNRQVVLDRLKKSGAITEEDEKIPEDKFSQKVLSQFPTGKKEISARAFPDARIANSQEAIDELRKKIEMKKKLQKQKLKKLKASKGKKKTKKKTKKKIENKKLKKNHNPKTKKENKVRKQKKQRRKKRKSEKPLDLDQNNNNNEEELRIKKQKKRTRKIIHVRRIWIPSGLQAINLIFMLFLGIYRFFSWYLSFIFIFYVGILGGGVYANAFWNISKYIEPIYREFAMGSTSMADTIGIFLAGFLSLFVEPWLNSNKKY